MNITTMDQLEVQEIETILLDAKKFASGETWEAEKQTFFANLFYENSTRTKLSFEVAQKKLGFEVMNVDVSTSSVQKGESLYDTVKTLEAIGVNGIVIRHWKDNYFNELEGVHIPIINGGDGCGHHPTQSLLDLYTIHEHFGSFKNQHVVICGDLRHSRVARSNAKSLIRLGAKVSYSGPEEWFDQTLPAGDVIAMDEAAQVADVLMLLRIQDERHELSEDSSAKNSYLETYGLTLKRESMMKNESIIMHPAPVNRGVEIAGELVECKRSKIFKQMENGVFVRMAVLKFALQNREV